MARHVIALVAVVFAAGVLAGTARAADEGPAAKPELRGPGLFLGKLNLTDEQMEALLAGVAAVLAFSTMVQGKLSTTVPQFLAESGERSNIGLLVTALLAAAIYYFAKKFVIKE